MDIESLLCWAYRDELPKRHISSAEGIWTDMAICGPFGRVDQGHGAQRYDFGLPHPDALAIERAVNMLPDVAIDWDAEFTSIMGHLGAICEVSALKRPVEPPRETQSGWSATQTRTGAWMPAKKETVKRVVNRPRDVIAVGSVRTSGLIAGHAKQGTRPTWKPDNPQCFPVFPLRSRHPAVIGRVITRGVYSDGSCCPVRWDLPSPVAVALARGEYLAWWRGLRLLAESLVLLEHHALVPAVPEMPWRNPADPRWLYGRVSPPKLSALPLKPQRPQAGPPRLQGEDVQRAMRGRRKII